MRKDSIFSADIIRESRNAAKGSFYENFKCQLESKGKNAKSFVNQKYKNDQTFLHYAFYTRNLDLILLLLANGAKLNKQNKRGNTPIDIAKIHEERNLLSIFPESLKTKESINDFEYLLKLTEHSSDLVLIESFLAKNFVKVNDRQKIEIYKILFKNNYRDLFQKYCPGLITMNDSLIRDLAKEIVKEQDASKLLNLIVDAKLVDEKIKIILEEAILIDNIKYTKLLYKILPAFSKDYINRLLSKHIEECNQQEIKISVPLQVIKFFNLREIFFRPDNKIFEILTKKLETDHDLQALRDYFAEINSLASEDNSTVDPTETIWCILLRKEFLAFIENNAAQNLLESGQIADIQQQIKSINLNKNEAKLIMLNFLSFQDEIQELIFKIATHKCGTNSELLASILALTNSLSSIKIKLVIDHKLFLDEKQLDVISSKMTEQERKDVRYYYYFNLCKYDAIETLKKSFKENQDYAIEDKNSLNLLQNFLIMRSDFSAQMLKTFLKRDDAEILISDDIIKLLLSLDLKRDSVINVTDLAKQIPGSADFINIIEGNSRAILTQFKGNNLKIDGIDQAALSRKIIEICLDKENPGLKQNLINICLSATFVMEVIQKNLNKLNIREDESEFSKSYINYIVDIGGIIDKEFVLLEAARQEEIITERFNELLNEKISTANANIYGLKGSNHNVNSDFKMI